jgi:hypothetical protein
MHGKYQLQNTYVIFAMHIRQHSNLFLLLPDTLQETADLPGAKKFAGCFLSGTRQRNSLPGARPGYVITSGDVWVLGSRRRNLLETFSIFNQGLHMW